MSTEVSFVMSPCTQTWFFVSDIAPQDYAPTSTFHCVKSLFRAEGLPSPNKSNIHVPKWLKLKETFKTNLLVSNGHR